MSKYTLEITYDQVDQIVKDELNENVRGLLEDPWAIYHDYKKTKHLVDSLLTTLDFFHTPTEWKEYKKSIKKEYKALNKLVKNKEKGPV
jgi:hypothetical protein